MRIAVISPNSAHLEDIGRYLQTPDGSRAVALHEGGMSKVRVVADQQRPDLIIIDSMCRDLEELPVLEYVSAQHPRTVTVMLCVNQSPDFLIHAMRAGVREVLKSPVTKEVLLAAVHRTEQRLGLAARPRDPVRLSRTAELVSSTSPRATSRSCSASACGSTNSRRCKSEPVNSATISPR